MIQIVDSINKLDFSKLTELYKSDIDQDRKRYYPCLDPYEGRLCAENDLYIYLRDCFFAESRGLYYIYCEQGQYISGLRLERYRDGLLLNALMTDVSYRRIGYASALLECALSSLDCPVYSHVDRKNGPSIRIHEKFGFIKFLDHAVLLDGAVRTDHITYIKNP